MSLSRPVKFPLLKLPWLCIKCVLHNSDEFVLIYFATLSNRTRRIVKSSNYPLKEINVSSSMFKDISFGGLMDERENLKTWYFIDFMRENGASLVLQKNSEPFRTRRHFHSWRGHLLYSYTTGDELDALKMGIDFLIDVFGCTIRQVSVDGNKISELFGLGISTAQELFINNSAPVNIADLKFLLETIKVMDEFIFFVPIPEDFSCDPQIFTCRRLAFLCNHSADWVSLELLCQLDVPQLFFSYHRFSVEDIVSYITNWFNSENRKLEWVRFEFNKPISLDHFKIDHLNTMPFCEKRRNRFFLNVRGWEEADISSGKDILRQDDLLATLHAFPTAVLFYVWHKRFPDAVQQ